MKFQLGEIKQHRRKLIQNIIETKAILELLIEKGIITEEEYEKKVAALKQMALKRNPKLDI